MSEGLNFSSLRRLFLQCVLPLFNHTLLFYSLQFAHYRVPFYFFWALLYQIFLWFFLNFVSQLSQEVAFKCDLSIDVDAICAIIEWSTGRFFLAQHLWGVSDRNTRVPLLISIVILLFIANSLHLVVLFVIVGNWAHGEVGSFWLLGTRRLGVI